MLWTLATDLEGNPRLVDIPGVQDTGVGPFGVVDMGAVERQIPGPLEALPSSLSLSAGGVQTFHLTAPSQHAGQPFLLLGSTAGTSPGLPLVPHHLPMNPDPYFDWTLSNANVFPLANTFGTLDATGRATASFTLVPGSPPQWAGAPVHHAYVVFQTALTLGVAFASDAEELLLLP